MTMRKSVPLVLACVVSAARSSAAAPNDSAGAQAEALFVAAKKLMAAGDYANACPKLAESERLDPGSGTLAALAACDEHEGRTATAWSEFKDLIAAAQAASRPDREEFARRHVAQLEPLLSHMTITVSPAARDIASLVVQRDGIPVGAPSWGLAFPIDPGDHVVEATAPGHKTWSVHVAVGTRGDTQAVNIPPLEAIVVAAAPPPPEPTAPVVAAAPGGSSQKNIAFVVGGGGILLLGAGSYFGIQAISTTQQVKTSCPAVQCSSASTVALDGTAKSDAVVADILMGAGLAALVTGAILYFTDHPHPSPTGFRMAPLVGSATGVAAAGSF
jgi:hypothetical protein